jgi:hypothetical protein
VISQLPGKRRRARIKDVIPGRLDYHTPQGVVIDDYDTMVEWWNGDWHEETEGT